MIVTKCFKQCNYVLQDIEDKPASFVGRVIDPRLAMRSKHARVNDPPYVTGEAEHDNRSLP